MGMRPVIASVVFPAGLARRTLYFGRARPQGFVSELEWPLFLRDEVTSRFPDGLTAWGCLRTVARHERSDRS